MVVRTGTRRLRRVRHLLCAFALAVAAIAPAGSAFATDTSTAVQELRSSADFRVRVNAALFLGRAKPASARESLEHALSSDPHPAVRTAAAEALGSLGDPASIGALEQRLPVEGSSSVKAQLRATIAQLRTGATSPQGDDESVAGHLRADVRCVVSLGSMRNASGVRGDELRHLLFQREAVGQLGKCVQTCKTREMIGRFLHLRNVERDADRADNLSVRPAQRLDVMLHPAPAVKGFEALRIAAKNPANLLDLGLTELFLRETLRRRRRSDKRREAHVEIDGPNQSGNLLEQQA